LNTWKAFRSRHASFLLGKSNTEGRFYTGTIIAAGSKKSTFVRVKYDLDDTEEELDAEDLADCIVEKGKEKEEAPWTGEELPLSPPPKVESAPPPPDSKSAAAKSPAAAKLPAAAAKPKAGAKPKAAPAAAAKAVAAPPAESTPPAKRRPAPAPSSVESPPKNFKGTTFNKQNKVREWRRGEERELGRAMRLRCGFAAG